MAPVERPPGGADMPVLERPDGATIHYEVTGDGPPLLALAPGIVNSEVESWASWPVDPVAAFRDRFTVITMDQRHAGASLAPAVPFGYGQTAADQLAVLDALGAGRVVVYGAGIGANHALRLAHDAPGRVAVAVLHAPLGLDDTKTLGAFFRLFQETMRLARADGLEAVIDAALANPRFDENPAAGPFGRRLHADPAFRQEMRDKGRERYVVRVVRFRDGMFPAGRPLFSVPGDWLARCEVPLVVIPVDDALHPRGAAQRLAEEVPRARLLEGAAPDEIIEAARSLLAEPVQ
ncbi:MAG: hypothetical protein Kow0010_02590 [Dehalococcoidia bacterium]